MDFNEILNRRSDLSTFLVHLTRAYNGQTAKSNLESILRAKKIQARNVYGHLKTKLQLQNENLTSQKAICFTETPLEYAHLMTEPIDGRDLQFEPYGIAITKIVGRKKGVNPVWYLDMTPGHAWLTNNLDTLADRFLQSRVAEADLEKLFPFIEHMGTWGGGRKEFWWEREWRCVGDFSLPNSFICFCPELEFNYFRSLLEQLAIKACCIDIRWSLEKIIAHLAGFPKEDVEI